ncbi:hypothetical protein J31TS3_35030 [Paenibacillus lactis]|nr:hypothetical protein J31TS3_35030 [Paenibacillus lactis]
MWVALACTQVLIKLHPYSPVRLQKERTESQVFNKESRKSVLNEIYLVSASGTASRLSNPDDSSVAKDIG